MRRTLLFALLALGVAAQEGRPVVLLELRDAPLSDALRMISLQSGLNIVASSAAADRRITLVLRNLSAEQAIDVLCKTHELWYRRDRDSGVLRVHTLEEYSRELSSFRQEITEVFTLLYPNALEAGYAIRDLYGDRVLFSIGNNGEDQSDDLQQSLNRYDIFAERGQGLGIFDGTGGAALGGVRRGGGAGLNTQANTRNATTGTTRTSASDDRLSSDEVLALEAAGELQADVAERIRRARANIYVTVIQRNNQLLVRTSDQETMEQIRSLIRRLDVPTPLVLLEVKVMQVELGDEFNSVFDWQFTDTRNQAGGFTSGDVLPPASDGVEGTVARRMANLGLAGSGLNEGFLTWQFVHSAFRSRMQILEDDNRVTILATPLLLTANNEVSRLFVGEERPLNRGFSGGVQTAVDGGIIATTPGTTIEFRPIGTTLLISPNINADRTVTLRLLQETSSIGRAPATILVPSDNGFAPQQVDVVQSQTVSGTIVAKDGLAVAVGGLIEESVFETQSQVPVLGSIPLLGFLFKRENRGKTRKELIVMVRPFILSTPAETEAQSRQLLEELSLHPNAPDGEGSLDTYGRDDVIRPEDAGLRGVFEFHSRGEGGP